MSVRTPATLIATSTLALTLMGGVAGAATARGDHHRPTRPGALSVQTVATVSATVAFGRSHDDRGIRNYRVYANGHLATSTRRTSGVLVHLRCGTSYTLGARAVDRAGNVSTLSPVAHLRTHACLDTVAPARPAGLHVVRRTDRDIQLAWSRSLDPGHGAVQQYLVYRDGAVVAGSHATTFDVPNLKPGHSYRLGVRARDAVGNVSTAAEITVATAPPPQATGGMRTFLLATDTASIQDGQAHYRDLDWIYPTYFTVDPRGFLTGSDQPAVTRWFQQRGVKVLPRFWSEDSEYIEHVTTDPAARAQLVNDVVAAILGSGFDGASLDLEPRMPTAGIDGLTKQERWDRFRSGFAVLVEELAARLHAHGKLLSVDVAPNWCSHTNGLSYAVTYCSSSTDRSATTRPRPYLYDYRAMAAAADELWVMSWGLHWSTSEPGPVANAAWLSAVGAYYADLFADEPALVHKLTLGVQLYGFDWSSVTVRVDTVPRPGPVPAAPPCYAGSAVTARPVYSYTGSDTAGTLTITWLCNTRSARPLEYSDIVAEADALGATPTWDPVAGEEYFTLPDPEHDGAVRTVWFTDGRSMIARADIVRQLGWRLGEWRLGHEDPAVWTPSVTSIGAGS